MDMTKREAGGRRDDEDTEKNEKERREKIRRKQNTNKNKRGEIGLRVSGYTNSFAEKNGLSPALSSRK